MNKFRINVDADLLAALHRCIDENTLPDHYLDSDQKKRLGELMDQVGIAGAMKKTMDMAGKPVFESDDLAVYEHPEKGDEAPLMIFSKLMGELLVETPFYDCDDMDEVDEWLWGKQDTH